MKKRSSFLSAAVLLATAATFHVLLLVITGLDSPSANVGTLLLWWACLLGTHFTLLPVLRKPRSLRTVILLELAGFSLQLTLTVLTARAESAFLYWLMGCILWGTSYFRCHQFLFAPPKAEQVMLGFELTVAALFLTALLVSTGAAPTPLLLCMLLSCVLSLAALAQLRSGHRRAQGSTGGKGRLLSAALLGGPAAAAALLALLFTDGAAGAVTRLLTAVRRLFSLLFRGVETVVRWLVSLIPEGDMEYTDPPLPGSSGGMTGVEGDTMFFDNRIVLYIALGCVILGLLLFLGYRLLRGGRSKTTVSLPDSRTQVRRSPRFAEVLSLFLRRLKARASRFFAYLRGYHTAPGLFLWLERRLRGKRGRQTGETPRAFLKRTETLIPDCGEDLRRLADCLDAHYFGYGMTVPAADIRSMRRRLRRALGK